MRPMFSKLSFALALVLLLAVSALAAPPADVLPSKTGDVTVSFIGHGTLMFQWQGKVVHVDPWTRLADYDALPKADLILVTHEHGDHLDGDAIKKLRKDAAVGGTVIGAANKASATLSGAVVFKNGETKELAGIRVDAVPAYNIKNERPNGEPFHPKGHGHGYVIHFGELRVYVAGDTEDVPEMAALKGVEVAFLPVNMPYTMSTQMLLSAVAMVQPKILYPYHTTDTNMAKVEEALRAVPGVEVRIRPMK